MSAFWKAAELTSIPTITVGRMTLYRISGFRTPGLRLTLHKSEQVRFALPACYLADSIPGALLESQKLRYALVDRTYKAEARAALDKLLIWKVRVRRDIVALNLTAGVNADILSPMVVASEATAGYANMQALYDDVTHPAGEALRKAWPDCDAFYWASRYGGGMNVMLLREPDECLSYSAPSPLLENDDARQIVEIVESTGLLRIGQGLPTGRPKRK